MPNTRPSSTLRISHCGGVNDDCDCGMNNPYPCCDNNGNCTWWCWHQACCVWHHALPIPSGPGFPRAHAKYWASFYRQRGYHVTSTPAVNTIACRDQGTYGHVAWVEEIRGDRVYVSEMNCNVGPGGVNRREWPISYFTGGFIHQLGSNEPGFGKIERGVNIGPKPTLLGQDFQIDFGIRETAGRSIRYHSVAIDLWKGGAWLGPLHVWRNVGIAPNQLWGLTHTARIEPSQGPGIYHVVARGSVDGHHWWDFQTTPSGNRKKHIHAHQAPPHAWVSLSAINLPGTVGFDDPFNIDIELREIRGQSITFEKVAIAILRDDYQFMFDFALIDNVTINANGRWQHTARGQIYRWNPTGIYRAMVRAKLPSGEWFDITAVNNVQNPSGFVVNDGR